MSKQFEVVRQTLLQLQVCSPIPPERSKELEFNVQQHFPAGTTNNWRLDDQEHMKPVKCWSTDGNWHYMFIC